MARYTIIMNGPKPTAGQVPVFSEGKWAPGAGGGEPGPQGEQGIQGEQGPQGIQGEPGSAGPAFLIIPWHSDGSAAFAMTNSPNAERFAFNQPTRMIKLVPLNGHTQVRMVGIQVVTSASANTPRARLVYKTGAYSTTIGQYAELGATEVGFTLTGTGVRDTGWIDLVAGAVGDIQVGLTERGGDGTADPAFGHLQVMFR